MSEVEHWRQLAACKDEDPDVMQPEVATVAEVEDAKAHCAGCPVWLECRELAESQDGGAFGVHAGEWWGDAPRRPAVPHCTWCNTELEPDGRRPTGLFCSTRCRVAAHRARHAKSA